MTASPAPETVMTFPDLDQAESALDWIGIDFVEGEACFIGELDEDAAELLDAACADDETPQAVRALALILRERWRDAAAPRGWKVTFPA
ncbi:MAG: hypothetical protein WCK58_17805 [Chloroflexota bacterium]